MTAEPLTMEQMGDVVDRATKRIAEMEATITQDRATIAARDAEISALSHDLKRVQVELDKEWTERDSLKAEVERLAALVSAARNVIRMVPADEAVQSLLSNMDATLTRKDNPQ